MTTPALVQLGEMLKRVGEGEVMERLSLMPKRWIWCDPTQCSIGVLCYWVKNGRLRLRPGTQSEEE